MRLAASTLGCTEKSIEEAARLYSACGIRGMELRGIGGVLPCHEIPCLSERSRRSTLELLGESGIELIGLGTSAAFHTESCEAALDEGRRAIDVCADMGIGFIRVFGNRVASDGPFATAERVAGGIASLCDYAEGSGVSVLLEVHGDFNRKETLEPLLSRLSETDSFGVIWDVMHSDRAYGEDIDGFCDFIAPYTRHVHLKDYLRKEKRLVLMGEGDVPVRRIVDRLASHGYGGYLSFEWERLWHSELVCADVAFPHFVKYMNGILAETEN